MLSEVRGKQTSYDITYMWNLKKDTNELIAEQKQTHRLIEQTYSYQREHVGGGMDWGFGIGICTLGYMQ